MADYNHVISLGIGSPAGIPEFLTFGLQIGAAAAYSPAPDCRTLVVPWITRTYIVSACNRTEVVPAICRTAYIPRDSRVYVIPEEEDYVVECN